MTSPAPAPARILVVEDDAELRGLLQRYLGENGYAVKTVSDGASLDRAYAREPFDAIVLDLGLPGEDGLSICRRLRAAGDDVPIIILTARGDPVDRIVGIEMGADDYMAKPFTPRELVARLAAVLRRSEGRASRLAPGDVFAFGPFQLNIEQMTLTRDGAIVELSSREFALLSTLARHAGKPLTRARIVDLAFGRDAEVNDRAVDVQITRLRRALGDDPADPKWIRTVWGTGYVLTKGEAP